MKPRSRMTWISSRWLSMMAILVAFALTGLAGARADAVTSVDTAGLAALLNQGVKVVDIRRVDEWRDTGVIEGSTLITAIDANGNLVEDFPQALMNAVARDEPVVVICRSGNRSAAISQMMSEQGGYSHVIDAAGGMRAWLGAGKAVTPCPTC